MYLKSLELRNFRNYETLSVEFDRGANIFFGDNAQGKTNILEAIYMSATTRSHKGSKDQEVISFNSEEAHIRSVILKDDVTRQIDMHLRKGKSKGIALDGQRLKKASDMMGMMQAVFFSPEDLCIIKDGPSERRRFMDMELCQLDSFYLYNLTNYNKTVMQRAKLLKEIGLKPGLKDTLPIWDAQLLSYGLKLIERRQRFVEELGEILIPIHEKISDGREELTVVYEKNTSVEDYESRLTEAREKDIITKQTTVGPHRDDLCFLIKTVGTSERIDVRKYGSQGQQRSVALSLKLAEIELIKKISKESPILLLDDVLSELDRYRQNCLLNSIGETQTIITCTGLDDFVKNRFEVDRVFYVEKGTVTVPEKDFS